MLSYIVNVGILVIDQAVKHPWYTMIVQLKKTTCITNTPITHPRFATKILLRSEVKENELRTQWDLYKPTEDSV